MASTARLEYGTCERESRCISRWAMRRVRLSEPQTPLFSVLFCRFSAVATSMPSSLRLLADCSLKVGKGPLDAFSYAIFTRKFSRRPVYFSDDNCQEGDLRLQRWERGKKVVVIPHTIFHLGQGQMQALGLNTGEIRAVSAADRQRFKEHWIDNGKMKVIYDRIRSVVGVPLPE